MSDRLKWLVIFWGLALLLPGLMALLAYCCLASWTVPVEPGGDPQALVTGVGFAVILAVTVGGGGFTYYHGTHSQAKHPSQPLRLPPLWAFAGAFPLVLALGLAAQQSSTGALFLFPVPVIAAAVMPPVSVLVWMMDGQPGTLTWRRATVAFVAGATVCVGLALALELILLGLAGFALQSVGELLPSPAGPEVARVLASPGFVVVLVTFGAVAPLVEEMVKPLITLPLLPHLKRPREALLLGAVAGAGFGALENVIYVMAGMPVWVGTLALRALGAAVHPLTAGLVTVGWFRVLRREPAAGSEWLGRYGLAVGIHALWNGGSVLLLASGGVCFLGEAPPDVGVFGATITGSMLALLAFMGVLAFVAARVVARHIVPHRGRQVLEKVLRELSQNQTMAVWAVVVLITVLSVGLAGLGALW